MRLCACLLCPLRWAYGVWFEKKAVYLRSDSRRYAVVRMLNEVPMNRIFDISGLDDLREFLHSQPDADVLRERLYGLFLEYSCYSNAAEWNAAVRICEALAIMGWGDHEPLEARKGRWFNGNPETCFINRDGKVRFLEAVWSKRKDGLAIDYDMSFVHGDRERAYDPPVRCKGGTGAPQDVKLCSQRNWIAKNPIRIVRGLANCYDSSKPVVESMDRVLTPMLNRKMRPELYGASIDAIVLNVSFSFYDNYHCKTNYIIADETLGLRQRDFYPKLLEMYTEKEIDDNGYYLRNRFTYGPFRKDTGSVRVNIVLEREFSQLSVRDQKRLLGEYLLHAVEQVARRLGRKICYDFQLMISDFRAVLNVWTGGAD